MSVLLVGRSWPKIGLASLNLYPSPSDVLEGPKQTTLTHPRIADTVELFRCYFSEIVAGQSVPSFRR